MPTRSAKADWQGDFKRGGGNVSTETGILDSQYNFSGRFESGSGTNPEELIAAAHASCFTMALSVGLTQAGNPPESLATEAHVTIDEVEGGFGITKIALSVTGKVPGLDAAGFEEAANGAKAGCPVSKALAGVPEITLETTFES
jgi:osmotically inducible protein OsmC